MKTTTKIIYFIPGCYLIIILLTILFSYTQIDLNLTLWSNPVYQNIQQKLLYIGYYQRPLASAGFLFILITMFSFYFWILMLTIKRILPKKSLKIFFIFSLLLIIAYPAFSHDLFNYMFDARIMTKYHLSPYFFKALDFPGDQWTRFMHWTHRYYPYGPFWLWLTLIPSFLGFNKFVLTLAWFKFMFLGFHLLNLKMIQLIIKKISPNDVYFAVIFYAFNPLVLLETLVSPHNEVAMLSFVLIAVYFILKQKSLFGSLTLLFSILIKYISGAIVIVMNIFMINNRKFYELYFYSWLIFLIPLIFWREPYAWYVIPLVGLASLTRINSLTKVISLALSLGTLYRYYPYILNGDYNLYTQKLQYLWLPISFISVLGLMIWRRKLSTFF